MHILQVDPDPFATVPFLNAAGGGQIETCQLPVLYGEVDALPPGLEALVVTSDLQGREPQGRLPGRLLGVHLAEQLPSILAILEFDHPDNVGVILAGDFHTPPLLEKRGGYGPVLPVWQRFAEQFRWVAGVLGNHDQLDPRDLQSSGLHLNAHLLDGEVRDFTGLRIGGVSGIVGPTERPNRRERDRFLQLYRFVLDQCPDIVLSHQGPSAGDRRGDPELQDFLERWAQTSSGGGMAHPLILCGHRHWRHPWCELKGGLQILNVDRRAVVLARKR